MNLHRTKELTIFHSMVTNYVINLEYKANAMKKIILAGFLVVGLMACSDSSNKEVNAHDSLEMG